MVESLLLQAGLNWSVPVFSTVSRRQNTLTVVIPCQPNRSGLHLQIDSTDIKMLGEGEWRSKKHGADYCRQWWSVHLGIDTETLEIRAIEVSSSRVGDVPKLPELLQQIPTDESILSFSGAGAYEPPEAVTPPLRSAVRL